MNLEVWKEIPEFVNYEASSKGAIRSKDGRIVPTNVKKIWGCYLTVNLVTDTGRTFTALVNVLVCSAFHGPKPKPKMIANHLDGNKENNASNNLEWATRSENLIHAFKSGLRKDNCSVTVHDVVTGETKDYYSLNNFAESFKLPVALVRNLRCKKNPTLEDRYQLTFNVGGYSAPKHTWIRSLVAKDYVTGKVIIADTMTQMSTFTGVVSGTIQNAINSEKERLVNGYVFRWVSNETNWPQYTADEITQSKIKWNNKKQNWRKKKVGTEVKNYLTNAITTFPKLDDCAAFMGMSKANVQLLLFAKELRVSRGLCVRYVGDTREWPVIDREYAVLTTQVKSGKYNPIRVTDITSDTTKLYANIAEFAKEYQYNPVSVANWVASKSSKPMRGRFYITKI